MESRASSPDDRDDNTRFDPLMFDFDAVSEEASNSDDPADSVSSEESIDFNPTDLNASAESGSDEASADPNGGAFRTPGGPATTSEILKFLIDRTGYIKQLEDEDTPEAFSRTVL